MKIDMKPMEFVGKKVLVTGGTRGIGATTAAMFAHLGASVTLTGTDQDGIREFQRQYDLPNVSGYAVRFDDLQSTSDFCQQIADVEFDILVNNAGMNKVGPFVNIEIADWQRIQDVNLRAPFMVSQVVAKNMQTKKSGRIVHISSVFGIVSKEHRVSYSTSKAGLIGMMKAMALELAPYGILVNAISPGFIDTELTRKVLGETGIEQMLSKVPLQKLGTTEDIARLALFLCSEWNQFITGENVVIDGGFTSA